MSKGIFEMEEFWGEGRKQVFQFSIEKNFMQTCFNPSPSLIAENIKIMTFFFFFEILMKISSEAQRWDMVI